LHGSERLNVGQIINSDDGVIEVIVVRVGSGNERSRLRIRVLKPEEKAKYTIILHRASRADAHRINYETDNWRNVDDHEFSCDPISKVEIKREKR
jgi:hypothetical protein